MAVLEAQNLYLSIGEKYLVKDVSLSIQAGEIISIVGPNGAGKTSLLKLLSGEVDPSSGNIQFAGKPLTEWPLQTLATKRAVLPQLSLLNFPYTVEEVIALGRSPHSSGKDSDNQIVQQLISEFDLEHLRESLYIHLSGGEKQRTQLARVVAQVWQNNKYESTLLFLDEPTNALDLRHQQQLRKYLRALADLGVAIFLVVHDLTAAAKISDRIMLMSLGKTIAFGEPKTVLTETSLSEVFGAQISVVANPITGELMVVS